MKPILLGTTVQVEENNTTRYRRIMLGMGVTRYSKREETILLELAVQ